MTRSIERRFEQFHAENPHVMAKLREIALAVKRSGKKQFGIAALFERLRWISEFETSNDAYKLNNSLRAPYARALMAQEPDLRGFFETRERARRPQQTQVRRHFRRKKGAPKPPAAPTMDARLF